MFRLSRYLNALIPSAPASKLASAAVLNKYAKNKAGPVVIWNLIRRCNLTCKHCYATSADKNFPNELNTAEIYSVMNDLADFKVPVLILSGGEPLMHPDIFNISLRAKKTSHK